MIAVLQRVALAAVTVDGVTIGEIGRGLMVLVGVQKGDGPEDVEKLLERLLIYRVFPDDAGKMNRSLTDVDGGLLLVPQFTLAADTRKGTRPSFSSAAPPDEGRALFEQLVVRARERHRTVATGRFGADMKVALVNDGPVTFVLDTR